VEEPSTATAWVGSDANPELQAGNKLMIKRLTTIMNGFFMDFSNFFQVL
jgi:hypothetical protein